MGADCFYLAVCAFPYLLAFTPDSMEIRLVVNGNLVHTAVVPQLQLVASRVSRTGFYFHVRGLGSPSTVRFQVSTETASHQVGWLVTMLLCVTMPGVRRKGNKTEGWADVCGLPSLHSAPQLCGHNHCVAVAVGDTQLKREIHSWISAQKDHASIEES